VVKRGEVWLVALDPTVGREMRKTRPAVIVSPSELHDHLQTVLVAPMTTAGFPAPFRIPLVFKGKSGLVLPDQIRAVDRQRLVKRVGRLQAKTLAATLRVLQELFAE
jgi:mRNA interferase MazF